MASSFKIGIIGKGALGLLYGGIIDQTLGAGTAQFIMDDERLARHSADTYTINGAEVRFADVPASKAEPVDLLLLAVKATGLEAALQTARAAVGPDTVIVPLLNGITSEPKTAAAFGWERTVGCVSYGMDAERYGTSLEYTTPGELLIGALEPASQAAAERADQLLTACGIPHTVVPNIKHRLYAKWMANVGVNQVCAVFQLRYAQLFADDASEAMRTYVGALREAKAVANAEGVALTEDDLNGYVSVLHQLDPGSWPSMAQDRANGNRSEVEEFSGEVIRLAEKHGLLVPCNRFLYAEVAKYEASL